MLDASCPDKLQLSTIRFIITMKHRLPPNKVVIEVIDGKENDVDIIAQ